MEEKEFSPPPLLWHFRETWLLAGFSDLPLLTSSWVYCKGLALGAGGVVCRRAGVRCKEKCCICRTVKGKTVDCRVRTPTYEDLPGYTGHLVSPASLRTFPASRSFIFRAEKWVRPWITLRSFHF